MKLNIKKIGIIIFCINMVMYSWLTYEYIYLRKSLIEPVAKAEKVEVKKVAVKAEEKTITDLPKANHFPFGQCTWYVATKRNVPWNGNAIDWYGNSQKYGRKVGVEPKVGAILVTRESWVGHVAYVESLNGISFVVSEMNNPTWGKVTKRTLTKQSIPFVGFIY